MVLNVCYHINKRNFKSPLNCGGLFVQCLFPCAFLNPVAPIPWLPSKKDTFSKVPLHNKSNIRPPRAPWGPLDSGLMRIFISQGSLFPYKI